MAAVNSLDSTPEIIFCIKSGNHAIGLTPVYMIYYKLNESVHWFHS